MSHDEEDSITGLLLPEPTGFYVDIGAGDGVFWSNTFHFLKRGWSGVAIDANPEKVANMREAYEAYPQCVILEAKVTLDNLDDLLTGVPEYFDFLSLDIDGYDLHILRALLTKRRPKVICMEYQPHFPPGIKFSVKYDPDHWWKVDGFFGCSIEAAVETLEPLGYGIEAVILDNVIFNHGTSNFGWQSKWESGFLNREDKVLTFYNQMSRMLRDMNPEEAFLLAERFYPLYKGKYEVWK